jgi:hypothetical protein
MVSAKTATPMWLPTRFNPRGLPRTGVDFNCGQGFSNPWRRHFTPVALAGREIDHSQWAFFLHQVMAFMTDITVRHQAPWGHYNQRRWLPHAIISQFR